MFQPTTMYLQVEGTKKGCGKIFISVEKFPLSDKIINFPALTLQLAIEGLLVYEKSQIFFRFWVVNLWEIWSGRKFVGFCFTAN